VGDVTILVNNAAVVHGKSLLDSDDDALLKSQHINTMGQFWVSRKISPALIDFFLIKRLFYLDKRYNRDRKYDCGLMQTVTYYVQ